jgi:hypothetical protein
MRFLYSSGLHAGKRANEFTMPEDREYIKQLIKDNKRT